VHDDISGRRILISAEGGVMMLPSMSVVTPSLNQGRFIEGTIRSVLSQDTSGVEYVIIDGGSTDETLSVLRRYETHVRWISQKDRGQADAVNKGIIATRGDIIGWINSDDIYYPGAFSTVLNFFSRHPEVDIVYGDADHVDVDGEPIEPYYTESWDYERLKDICFLCQPAVFFRRRLTERVGLLDVRLQYCMDYEYWLRVGAVTPLIWLRHKLAGSRLYADNKTLRARVDVHREINDMLREKFGMVPVKWIHAYARAVVDHGAYDRGVTLQDLKYVCSLIRVSLAAFIHWKQMPSVKDVKAMVSWAGGAGRNLLGHLRD
jgi:glycosyltransferase involved in cell wall biosynthesis